jgi:uncharacterized protein with PQ loop repeat
MTVIVPVPSSTVKRASRSSCLQHHAIGDEHARASLERVVDLADQSAAGTSIADAGSMTEALGWASSLVLLATITAQLRKQWQGRSSRGVSKWLFVGQALASLGFTLYSALLKNWVFTVTNALLLLSALLGIFITFYFQRGARPSLPHDEKRGKRDEMSRRDGAARGAA